MRQTTPQGARRVAFRGSTRAKWGSPAHARLRDRELGYLHKIGAALAKIGLGRFGICEDCEEEIPEPRFRVRPVAHLCIKCKERQEHVERGFR